MQKRLQFIVLPAPRPPITKLIKALREQICEGHQNIFFVTTIMSFLQKSRPCKSEQTKDGKILVRKMLVTGSRSNYTQVLARSSRVTVKKQVPVLNNTNS